MKATSQVEITRQNTNSTVAQVSQPADAGTLNARIILPRLADLSVSVPLRRDRAEAKGEGGEVGDTAGLETRATVGGATVLSRSKFLASLPRPPQPAPAQAGRSARQIEIAKQKPTTALRLAKASANQNLPG